MRATGIQIFVWEKILYLDGMLRVIDVIQSFYWFGQDALSQRLLN